MSHAHATHLAPELRRLAGDALLLWADASERGQALNALVDAWSRADAAGLRATAARIDAAVAAGLEALRLPRDPGVRVDVGSYNRRWIGHVGADGTMAIDVDRVRRHLAAGGGPERIFHTWVHEALHARQPAAPTRSVEYASWPGYEEGMVEGLARVATGSKAAMAVEAPSYEFYVLAYRSLAVAADIDAERLWRLLWLQRPGDVRKGFATAVDALRAPNSTSPASRAHLTTVADRVFAADRYRDRPDAAVLARLWEAGLR